MERKQPLVEIIILSADGKQHLEKCLKSLKKVNYQNLKITVVDQGSIDGTSEFVKKNYPKINLIRNEVGKGFAGGNNQALRKSKAKYCILLNDDTEQEPNWISELVKVAEKDDKIAALQPKVLAMRDKKKFEYAGACGGHIDIYGYPICRGRVFDNLEEDSGQYDDVANIFWSCGVAMLIRRKVLDEIGYMDEDFYLYSEEMDLGWRMNLVGYKQFVVPESVVYHLGSATTGKKDFRFRKEYLLHRNVFVTLLKNFSRRTWWMVVPVKVALEFLAFGTFLFSQPKKSLAILASLFWIFFNVPEIARKNEEISYLKKISDEEIMKRMIRRSAVLGNFLSGKKSFKDYEKDIEKYKDFY